MKAHWREAAHEAGLPLEEPKKVYNTRLAQELAKWAEVQGEGDPFHNAVFRAFFVDGKDISNIPELTALAESIGLPAKEAEEVLETRTFKEVVDGDWSRGHEMGVRSVPTFVMNQRGVVGAQPYLVLEQLMKISGVKSRASGG